MSTKKPTALKGGVNKLHVVKGDRVKVITGKDKGLVGEVLAVFPERQKVTVAGVNIAKRHLKDTTGQQQGRSATTGGIVSSEAPIHASNVQLVVKNESGEEVVTRVGYDRVEVTKRRPDGSEYKSTRAVRIARVTGEEI
jgi:large subunit ribosomal protein L24